MNLTLWGGGLLNLDITARRATINRLPIEPLPYADDALHWLKDQIAKNNIPREQFVSATLSVEYTVSTARRSPGVPILDATFDFSCTSSILSPDRAYTAILRAEKTWGLMQV